MDQIIYALLAMMLLAIFSLTMQRGILSSQNEMVVNEVATQLTGVGNSVMGFISKLPFDENTDESEIPEEYLTYPVVQGDGELTASSAFGGCTALEAVRHDTDPSCDDIDDAHGLTGETTVNGLPYTFEVCVRYVDPNNLPSDSCQEAQSQPKSFTKEVEVTVESPHLQAGGEPMPVRIKKLFTYHRHIQAP